MPIRISLDGKIMRMRLPGHREELRSFRDFQTNCIAVAKWLGYVDVVHKKYRPRAGLRAAIPGNRARNRRHPRNAPAPPAWRTPRPTPPRARGSAKLIASYQLLDLPAADERDDFDFVAVFERGFIFVAAQESAVQLNRNLFGRELIPLDQLADGQRIGQIFTHFAIYSQLH